MNPWRDCQARDVAEKLAAQPVPFRRGPIPKGVLRTFWATVSDTTYAADGRYGLTEQMWDQTQNAGKGGLVNRPHPPGHIADGYEIELADAVPEGEPVLVLEGRDKDGTLKLLFRDFAPRLRRAKATQNWSFPHDGSLADCKDGLFRIKGNPWVDDDWDTGTELTIYLPIPTDGTDAIGHPNVVTDNILWYRVDDDGSNIAVAPQYMDAPIGTLRWWHPNATGTPARIPQGWQLCDGTNDPQGVGTPDIRGYDLKPYYSDTGLPVKSGLGFTGDYADVEETGGTAWYEPPAADVAAGSGEIVAAREEHDQRGAWYCAGLLIRVDNSHAWT